MDAVPVEYVGISVRLHSSRTTYATDYTERKPGAMLTSVCRVESDEVGRAAKIEMAITDSRGPIRSRKVA